MLKPGRFAALAVLISTSLGADGVLEINQACALNGGCFAGDSAGFPVTIDGSAGVSYRLTGSLDLSSTPNTSGIEIDAPNITIDLNGFEIAGPITCTGEGATLNCGSIGDGNAIDVSNGSDGVLIRNGILRNMANSGVGSSAAMVTIKDVRAVNNAGDGFRGQNNSIVVNSIAIKNGADGFDFGVASTIEGSTAVGNGDNGFELDAQRAVVVRSSTQRNGGRGFELGILSRFRDNTSDFNEEPDRCGGGLCTDRKRIYLTQTKHDGANVLNACTGGFHMASLPEIWEFSGWQYDYVLGDTIPDSGRGAPVGRSGWIRTGSTDDPVNNCDVWTSNSGGDSGRAIVLPIPMVWDDSTNVLSPWQDSLVRVCSFEHSVWCAED